MFLIEILTEVTAIVHAPGNEVALMAMNANVFFLSITGDLVPLAGQNFVAFC